MTPSMTYQRIPRGTPDLARAETMAAEAIRVAEALMWAIYGTDEVVHAGVVAGALHGASRTTGALS
jgi:hypothetical protein